jgi:hypothetical protein
VSAKRRCGGRSTPAQKEPEAELGRLYYVMREEVQMQRAGRDERHSYWTWRKWADMYVHKALAPWH